MVLAHAGRMGGNYNFVSNSRRCSMLDVLEGYMLTEYLIAMNFPHDKKVESVCDRPLIFVRKADRDPGAEYRSNVLCARLKYKDVVGDKPRMFKALRDPQQALNRHLT